MDNISPFIFWCQKVMPAILDDSLSYYECLCKLTAKLNETINVVNSVQQSQSALQNSFNELKNYVDNYFENLNVQNEINNKLDQMAEDGTLASLNLISYFDSVGTMKTKNLLEGATVKTAAYLAGSGKGGAYYYITNAELNFPYEVLNNGLKAYITNLYNPYQLGAYGVQSSDDTYVIENYLNYNNDLNNGDFWVQNLSMPNANISNGVLHAFTDCEYVIGFDKKGVAYSDNKVENITIQGEGKANTGIFVTNQRRGYFNNIFIYDTINNGIELDGTNADQSMGGSQLSNILVYNQNNLGYGLGYGVYMDTNDVQIDNLIVRNYTIGVYATQPVSINRYHPYMAMQASEKYTEKFLKSIALDLTGMKIQKGACYLNEFYCDTYNVGVKIGKSNVKVFLTNLFYLSNTTYGPSNKMYFIYYNNFKYTPLISIVNGYFNGNVDNHWNTSFLSNYPNANIKTYNVECNYFVINNINGYEIDRYNSVFEMNAKKNLNNTSQLSANVIGLFNSNSNLYTYNNLTVSSVTDLHAAHTEITNGYEISSDGTVDPSGSMIAINYTIPKNTRYIYVCYEVDITQGSGINGEISYNVNGTYKGYITSFGKPTLIDLGDGATSLALNIIGTTDGVFTIKNIVCAPTLNWPCYNVGNGTNSPALFYQNGNAVLDTGSLTEFIGV